MLPRTGGQDSLSARLDGPDGFFIIWSLRDPVALDGWESSRVAMVKGLLPHIRQFVRVRQALVRAEARTTTVTALLDNPRVGVLHLDRRGRIIEANDRARSILQHGDGLADRDGTLRARAPTDQVHLERLVEGALPASGAAAVSGSILLRRSPVLPPFVIHVKPVGVPQPDYGARHVAALVLIVEPGRQRRVDPDLVARGGRRVDLAGRATICRTCSAATLPPPSSTAGWMSLFSTPTRPGRRHPPCSRWGCWRGRSSSTERRACWCSTRSTGCRAAPSHWSTCWSSGRRVISTSPWRSGPTRGSTWLPHVLDDGAVLVGAQEFRFSRADIARFFQGGLSRRELVAVDERASPV